MAAGNGRAPAPPPSLPQAPGGCRRCRPLAAAARPPPPQPEPWRARSAGSRRRAGRATAAAGGSGRRLGGRRRGRCRLPRCRAGPGRRCWARRGWRWAAASRRRSAGSGPCAAWAASSAPTCSSGAWGGGRAWAGGGSPRGWGPRFGSLCAAGVGRAARSLPAMLRALLQGTCALFLGQTFSARVASGWRRCCVCSEPSVRACSRPLAFHCEIASELSPHCSCWRCLQFSHLKCCCMPTRLYGAVCVPGFHLTLQLRL